MKVAVGSASDVGRIRTNNEDSYLAQAPLYVVADGMGGENAGEVASAMAIETLGRMAGEGGSTDLAGWVREANRAVWDRSITDRSAFGMGTTLTAVLADGERLRFAHVGDSRAYLLRDGEIRRLTDDHTRVARMVRDGTITEEEAAVHPERNIITRALGIGEEVKVDELALDVRDGDRILLCTDGLTGMVKEEQIRQILLSTKDPQEAARNLVEAANGAGGVDNITAIVLDIRSDVPVAAGRTKPSRRRMGAGGIAALAVVGLLVLGLVLNQAGAWPFKKSATPKPSASPTPSVSATPSASDTTGGLPPAIQALLPAGATVAIVKNSDLNGDGSVETLVALDGPEGPYLYAFTTGTDGIPKQLLDGRTQAPPPDAKTVVEPVSAQVPATMIGSTTINGQASPGSELVSSIDIVDFEGLTSPRAVVAIRSITPAGTLQVWVIALSPDNLFHADLYSAEIGANLKVEDGTIQIELPSGDTRTVSYDRSGTPIVTIGSSSPSSPSPTPTP